MFIKIKKTPEAQRSIIVLKDLKERDVKGIRQAFYKIGKDLKTEANKLILDKNKSGKVYRNKRGRHVSSAPGEAPANMTGNLRRSLDFNVVGSNKVEFGYREKFPGKTKMNGVFYGRYLELGTSKMKERPALRIAIKNNERNMVKHFERELQTSMQKT